MKYKINSQNASCMMGHINNFFGLPTVIDYGMQERIIRNTNPETFKTSYNKETYRNIIPQLSVSCKWHPMIKDNYKSFKDAPLLFISSIYTGSGICIHIGDIVEIKGSKLIIKNIYDMKALNYEKPTIHEFTHYKYTDEIKQKTIIQLLHLHISEHNWFDYDYYEEGFKDILKYLERELDEMWYNDSIKIDHWIAQNNKYILKLNKNIDKFIEYGTNINTIEDVFNFELIDKESESVLTNSSSLMDIAEYIYNKYKSEHPENFTDECTDDGYDYYEWD